MICQSCYARIVWCGCGGNLCLGWRHLNAKGGHWCGTPPDFERAAPVGTGWQR